LDIGKKAKNIIPLVSKFESSNKLYKDYRFLNDVVYPASIVLMIGGGVMAIAGSMDWVFSDGTTNPEDPDFMKPKRGLLIGGIAIAAIGTAGSIYYGLNLTKKLEGSMNEYNKRLKKQKLGLTPKRLDIGLGGNAFHASPTFSIRLGF
jgi:hypothetical protein